MQNRLFRFSVLLTALIVPGVLFAQATAAPSAVTGIQATAQKGTVTVSWNASPEQNIAYYRVYYSGNQSILESGGLYENFEATPDARTSSTLEYRPAGKTLYVSVMAVNTEGVESELFTEEAVVLPQKEPESTTTTPTLQEITPEQAPQEPESPAEALFTIIRPTKQEEPVDQSQNIPEWQQRDLGGTFHLILTDVVSPTELHLIFSSRPFVEPEAAPQAFEIVDSEGNALHIESVTIDGEEVTVQTNTQVPGRTYRLSLSEPLHGQDGSPLDEENRQSTFIGHEGNSAGLAEQAPTAAVQDQLQPPAPVHNLKLTTSSVLDGTYFVRATWETKNPQAIAYYSVRQSRDGGKTFGAPDLLAGNIGNIQIPKVTPGEYGLGISTLNALGFGSPEVFTTIRVGPQEALSVPVSTYPAPPVLNQAMAAPPVLQTGPVRETTVGSKDLSHSGPGLLASALMGLGATAGWRKKKSRKN
ncbi:hypothetical protein COU76_05700 [Candidatus Peregrinibacteria bacterium CG10_big_fil_rev_8_21_14_0_10_49_10]|nr:MAG: hypothetical protein COU76_05700 [Candidatus Peregrinibacteria bacterium CG10_big_fil_rev_8_21_14_0_10_49_10]